MDKGPTREPLSVAAGCWLRGRGRNRGLGDLENRGLVGGVDQRQPAVLALREAELTRAELVERHGRGDRVGVAGQGTETLVLDGIAAGRRLDRQDATVFLDAQGLVGSTDHTGRQTDGKHVVLTLFGFARYTMQRAFCP